MARDAASPAPDDDAAMQERIDRLVLEYVDRINAGERVSPSEVFAAHPALAAIVLEQLQTFVGLRGDCQGLHETEPRMLGDYRLARELGRGGMGIVYDAWESSMNRRVALKVLPAAVASDPRNVTRFVREAQAAGMLNHPSVVAVYGMGLKDGVPYYAMEYVEGETLSRALKRAKENQASPGDETPFGRRATQAYYFQLAEAFAGVADGLHHAHARKVIHRDIKPSNLIIDAAGRLRILDFGLARLEGQEAITLSGDLLGTPQYMSPEQARRRKDPVDHRTDVWSLGATLYEALAGRPPFQGADHHDTLSRILAEEPEAPRSFDARIPIDLETVVLKCLRKERGDRYLTAEALAQDLHRVARGEAVEARPLTAWERFARRLERRRRVVLAAAGAAAALFIALLATTWIVAGAYRVAEESRLETARELYISDMRLAMADWEAGNFARFESLLDRHRHLAAEPDLRGWEWRYLESLRHVPERTLEVDPGGVLAVAWNPTGETIAAGGDAGDVSIFRVADGERTQRLKVSDSPARAVAWNPDGTLLAGVAHDGTVRCWSLPGGEEAFVELPAKVLTSGAEQRAAAWSPDSRWLATAAGDGLVKVRDGRGGSVVRALATDQDTDCVPCLAWSPDGSRLAACFRVPTALVLWESTTWQELKRGSPAHGNLFFAAWSPNQKTLALGSARGNVHLWDAATFEPRPSRIEHTGHAFWGEWRPDGQRLATAGQYALVKVWKPESLDAPPVVLRGHRYAIWSVAWSPDGSRLASASTDGTVKVWDPGAAWGSRDLAGEDIAAWSRDGRWLAASSQDRKHILVWDSATWDVAARLAWEGGASSLSFDADGNRLVVTGGRDEVLRVLDARRGTELARADSRHGKYRQHDVFAAWSPHGEWIASGGPDGVPRIWDAGTLELREELTRHTRPLGALAWSPEGTRLAATSIDLVLRIFESGTWRQVHELRRRQDGLRQANYWTGRHAIAWSPDGSRLAATVSFVPNALAVFDARTGEEVFHESGHTSGLSCVAWSPDGSRLATGGFDRTVIIWDAERFQQVVPLGKHENIVTALLWSPDGRHLLSATKNELRIWGARPVMKENGE